MWFRCLIWPEGNPIGGTAMLSESRGIVLVTLHGPSPGAERDLSSWDTPAGKGHVLNVMVSPKRGPRMSPVLSSCFLGCQVEGSAPTLCCRASG